MKLSEALALRADLNKRIAEVAQRMVDNAKVQEGTPPAEDCGALLAKLEEMSAQLQSLIWHINKTNLETKLSDGRTLTEAIAQRDILQIRIAYHRRLADQGVIKQSVQTRSEVRFIAQIDVTKLREISDQLAREHRELDVLIQSANWTSELIEN